MSAARSTNRTAARRLVWEIMGWADTAVATYKRTRIGDTMAVRRERRFSGKVTYFVVEVVDGAFLNWRLTTLRALRDMAERAHNAAHASQEGGVR